MAGSSVYISTNNPESSPGDACGTSGTLLCEPECLVHPQFFCGQLLTDEDLNALLDWAKNKFRLGRYRLGWGVARGLQVTCDPSDPSAVRVAPGYALDACGNDIVVCKPERLPLVDACRLPSTVCAEPSTGSTGQSESTQFLGLSLPVGEIRVVDIFVRYMPVATNPLPALGRGACTEQEACEPSRTEERHELYWRDANGTAHPLQSELEAWECNYFSTCREVVDQVVEAAREDKGYNYVRYFDDIRATLLSWLERHPPHQFGFLRDAVDQLSLVPKTDLPGHLTRLLVWMVMDCRLAYLSRGCAGGDPEQGIPLARVVLRGQAGAGGCRVDYIDSIPPFRRPLSSDRWPAPPGMFNLGQLVWQRMETACAQIRDLGLEVTWQDLPETPHALQMALDKEWPKGRKGVVRSAHEKPPGLFLDLSCNGAESPIEVLGAQLETGVCDFGARAVSFTLKVSRDRQRGLGKEPGEASAERPGEREDIDPLTDIHGIGRERALKLRQEGIRTFAQLAATDPAHIQEFFPRVKREDIEAWLETAKQLTH